MNQFLVTSLFLSIYTSYRFCFPGEPWLITTLPQRYCQYPHFADGERAWESGPPPALSDLDHTSSAHLLSPFLPMSCSLLAHSSSAHFFFSLPPRVILPSAAYLVQVAALSLTPSPSGPAGTSISELWFFFWFFHRGLSKSIFMGELNTHAGLPWFCSHFFF